MENTAYLNFLYVGNEILDVRCNYAFPTMFVPLIKLA